jgi:hypothetical protein
LPGSQNPVNNFTSPNDVRNDIESSRGANVAHGRISPKKALTSLQCIKCAKLRRSCQGEPGDSCKYCVQNKLKCSFLSPRTFRCERCPRDYTTEAALKGHITRSHSCEISRSVDLDAPEPPHITSSSPSSTNQIPTSSLQNLGKSKISIDHIPNLSCSATTGPSEPAVSQRRW